MQHFLLLNAPHYLSVSYSNCRCFSTAQHHPTQYQYGAPGHYISPQDLMNVPPTLISSNLPQQPSSQPSGSNWRGKRIDEIGSLAPGAKHQLSDDPLPTAQSILDGSYSALANQKDIVLYVPRVPEHIGSPSLPSIVFSVNGTPGPYLKDILKQRVTLDNGTDTIFKDLAWKKTGIMVDWPGVASSGEHISCFMDKTRPITRTELAQIVANSVATIVSTGKSGKALKWGPQVINSQTRAWDLRKIDYRDVRLIAINYYRKLWVPVLAIDVD